MRLKRFENTQLYYVDEAIVIGSAEGDYVPLAEYQELRRLLERVDAIQLDYKLVLVDESYYYNYKEEFPDLSELTKLLSDIKEALK